MTEYLQNESYAICHIVSSIDRSKCQIKLERIENHKLINEIVHQYASSSLEAEFHVLTDERIKANFRLIGEQIRGINHFDRIRSEQNN